MSSRAALYVSLSRTVARASPLLVATAFSAPVDRQKEHPPVGSSEFYSKLFISFLLILLGGAFAGLTLALMGLDELHLRVLGTSSDDPEERKNANKVLKLLAKGRHWVLVVLLLGNVIVNESLPIFLDSAIGGGVAAVVISTIGIVIFGEIIPQAICARYGLPIGAKCAPLVLGMMYIFSPIAWPIAKLLDKVLGEAEESRYKKAELKSFLQFHRTAQEPLRDDEITILNGVLSLNEKRVDRIMTPMKDVVTLPDDMVLDHSAVDKLLTSGYSRFPVHKADNPTFFIGLLLVKKLITYDPDDRLPVNAFPLSILPEASPSINCFQALDYFQTGRAHLLLVSDYPGSPFGALGVVTLEDIIEEIIEEEIVDETDRYESNATRKRAKRMSTAAVMKGIVEREKGRRISISSNGPSRSSTPTPMPFGALPASQSASSSASTPTNSRDRDGNLVPSTVALETSALLKQSIREDGSPEQYNGRQGEYGATYVGSPTESNA